MAVKQLSGIFYFIFVNGEGVANCDITPYSQSELGNFHRLGCIDVGKIIIHNTSPRSLTPPI